VAHHPREFLESFVLALQFPLAALHLGHVVDDTDDAVGPARRVRHDAGVDVEPGDGVVGPDVPELELVLVVRVAGLDVGEPRFDRGPRRRGVLGMDVGHEVPDRIVHEVRGRATRQRLDPGADVEEVGRLGVGHPDGLVDPGDDLPEPHLALQEIGLDPAAVGDVPERREVSPRRHVRRRRELDGPGVTVRANQFELAGHRAFRQEPVPRGRGVVAGAGELRDVASQEGRPVVAEQVTGRGIGVDVVAVVVRDEERVRRSLEHGPEGALAVGERPFAVVPPGHVADDDEGPAAVGVENAGVDFEGREGAVVTPDRRLDGARRAAGTSVGDPLGDGTDHRIGDAGDPVQGAAGGVV